MLYRFETMQKKHEDWRDKPSIHGITLGVTFLEFICSK